MRLRGPDEVATTPAPCDTRLVGADGTRGTNEACVAELSDSSLLLNARDLSSIAGGGPTRLLQRSADGGASWSEPWRSPRLVQPASHRGCHGSMAAAAGGNSLFFVAPNSAQRRERLTLHRSDDGGRSWPRSLLLHAGPSAYSSVTLLPGGCLGVLYERGERRTSFFAEQVAFLRLPLAASAEVSVSPVGTLEESNATFRGTRTRGKTTFQSPGDSAI